MKHIFENINEIRPVIQCITNYVTINDCANIILAAGGSPTMAHHPREAEEIAAGCQGLVLNMGTMFDTDAMILAGKVNNELGHPVILDPVGVGASQLRKDAFARICADIHCDVIRGNITEIKKIATGEGREAGVDANEADRITEENVYEAAEMAKGLAAQMENVIVISGPIDVVADRKRAYLIRNGHPFMAKVTGTGCMSTALLGVFCAANPEEITRAAAAGCAAMGYAGELAYEKTQKAQGGTMTFRTCLIDEISLMTAERLMEGMRIEEV